VWIRGQLESFRVLRFISQVGALSAHNVVLDYCISTFARHLKRMNCVRGGRFAIAIGIAIEKAPSEIPSIAIEIAIPIAI